MYIIAFTKGIEGAFSSSRDFKHMHTYYTYGLFPFGIFSPNGEMLIFVSRVPTILMFLELEFLLCRDDVPF